jgi:hypothetical protein
MEKTKNKINKLNKLFFIMKIAEISYPIYLLICKRKRI